MDNKYFEVQTNKILTGGKLLKNEEIAMRICNKEEKIFASPNFWKKKPNMICIDNISKMKIQGNWNQLEYNIPYISIIECKNTTANKNKCASPLEIQNFVRNTSIITNMAKTLVSESTYQTDA